MSEFRRRLMMQGNRQMITSLLPPIVSTFEELESICKQKAPTTTAQNIYWGYKPEFMNGITLVTHIVIPTKIQGVINFCKFNAISGDVVYKFTINAIEGQSEYKLETSIPLSINESIAFVAGTSTSGKFYFTGTSESYFLERGFTQNVIIDSVVIMPYLVKGYK